jgi:hypothetical protein
MCDSRSPIRRSRSNLGEEVRHWWLALVILGTWEAEIRRIANQGQPGQKTWQDPISTNIWAQWCTPATPAMTGSPKQQDHGQG